MNNWLSIVPFLIAVVIAVLTRQVLAGLAIGLLAGCFAQAPAPVAALGKFAAYIISAVSDHDNLRIVVFLFVFGGLVGMIQVAGGVRGFARLVRRYVRSTASVLAIASGSILVTFMDCEFRIMTVGPVMKAVKGKTGATPTRIAYAIDTSTVPVIALLPIATTYAGYMLSVVGGALAESGVALAPYAVFVASIPYNFYAFGIIVIGVVGLLTGKYIGRGIAASPAGQADVREGENTHRESIEEELANVDPKPVNLIVPLAVLLGLTFYLIWRDGVSKGARSVIQAAQVADTTEMVLIALLATVFLTIAFYLIRHEKLSELMFHFVDGGNQIVMAILMLILVWAISLLAKDLGLARFVAATVGFIIPKALVPVAVFLAGCTLAYFIGSSWGTWGILMPLAVSLAAATGASLPATVGAVFASGCFGDFASPLGETTVTTSAVFGLPSVAYAHAKLPSALVAATLASVGFIIVGLRG